MKARIAHASFWAMAGSALQYLMLFGLLAYLTRILHPRDFGLMATVSIGLDLGLRIARWGQIELLQQPQYRNDSARNHAFRLSSVVASVIAVLIVALAWPLSRFYNSPELVAMSLIAAPVILINATSTTAEAVLRNEFRYNQIAFRNTISTLTGGAVAIILAVEGYGALSLAVQQLVQAAVGGIWAWRVIAWRPSFGRSSFHSESAAQQGAGIMIGSLLPQLVPRSFDLVVALALGPVQLGIMRVANRFNDFIGQTIWVPLAGVAGTELAESVPDARAMRWTYLRFTQASAAFACPLAIGTGLVAEEVVPILFGKVWEPSIAIVQISALLAFTLPISSYFAPTMVALGKRHVVVRQGLLDLALSIVLLAVVAGQPLPTVAAAYVIRCIFSAVCNMLDLRRHLHMRLRDLGAALAPPYIATLLMAACVLIARSMLGGFSPLGTLLILSSVGAAAYVSMALVSVRMRLWHDNTEFLARTMWGRAQRN